MKYSELSPEIKEHRNRRRRERRAVERIQTLNHYSNGLMKCGCCGESQERFLTLDHINNDGYDDKKRYSRSMLYEVKRLKYPKGFQVLCYNCNCGRADNQGVCPHKEI